ncbi:response regulator transcription factor [Maribellus sp. YY47]|uniref:response regulator transcription factor n=1 Tax=Maribellus sp. YY47 TaxID=2929486 RepID=UPI0020011E8D|nr:response regulator transcription factor [Maribellus sp. YY47]MCK3682714.1 response regulator transcription factor [Maribellus sp. YY47]
MCKVAILDKFVLFAAGIQSILDKSEGCEVIVQAVDCNDLFKQLKNGAPDVIIFDVIHGENSGMKQIKKIRRAYSEIPVLLILSQNYSDCFEEYIRLGVKGFVFNDATGDDLVKAIKRLHAGGEFFRKKVWDIFKTSLQKRKYSKKKVENLTEREVAVLKLFSSGLTYKEIGARLSISPRTVESHKRNILSKLKINSTADMVRYAFHHNILS